MRTAINKFITAYTNSNCVLVLFDKNNIIHLMHNASLFCGIFYLVFSL